MERLAEFQNLFHHLPLLVDLDGVHATVAALILVLCDSRVEGAMQLTQPVFQEANRWYPPPPYTPRGYKFPKNPCI